MTMTSARMEHSTQGASLADILDRILDKGVVIAGDIKVKIVDIGTEKDKPIWVDVPTTPVEIPAPVEVPVEEPVKV